MARSLFASCLVFDATNAYEGGMLPRDKLLSKLTDLLTLTCDADVAARLRRGFSNATRLEGEDGDCRKGPGLATLGVAEFTWRLDSFQEQLERCFFKEQQGSPSFCADYTEHGKEFQNT